MPMPCSQSRSAKVRESNIRSSLLLRSSPPSATHVVVHNYGGNTVDVVVHGGNTVDVDVLSFGAYPSKFGVMVIDDASGLALTVASSAETFNFEIRTAAAAVAGIQIQKFEEMGIDKQLF